MDCRILSDHTDYWTSSFSEVLIDLVIITLVLGNNHGFNQIDSLTIKMTIQNDRHGKQWQKYNVIVIGKIGF
jgi:Na+/H+ antiporter NhaA